MSKETSIYKILPYFNYEDGYYVMKDGRIFTGYAVNGFEMESLGEKELEDIRNQFNRFLQELPDNANVQKIDIYERRVREIGFHGFEKGSPFMSENLKEFIKGRKALEKTSYIFIELMPEKYSSPDPLRNFFTNQIIPKDQFKDLERNKKKLKSILKDFEGWATKYARLKDMGKEDIEDLMWAMLNLDFSEKKKYLEGQIDNSADEKLYMGGTIVSVLSMQEQGMYNGATSEKEYLPKVEVKEPFLFSVGLDLQIPHITVTNIRKRDRETGLKSFEKEILFTKNLPEIPAFKETRERALEVEAVLSMINKGKECVAEVSVTVLVWDRTAEIEEKAERVKQAIKRIEGSRPLEESKDKGAILMSCLPGNGAENFRKMIMPSYFASSYLDLSENYKTDDKGDILCDRFGNVVLFDNFHPQLVAQNAIVVGPTGSGKSFSQGDLIAQSYQRGEINVIIDKGGTYKSLTESLNIPYFEHTEESPLRFNPFACEKDEKGNYKLTEGQILMLRTLISILWKSEGKNEIFSNAESSIIMKLIPEFYKSCSAKSSTATLRGFVDFAKDMKNAWSSSEDDELKSQLKYFDADHLVVVLEPYTKGIYERIMNSEEALNLAEHKNICFDLEGVQKDPVLYPIISMMLINMVLEHVRKFPDTIKHIYFDEAWSFFTGEMKDFIAYMYRTIRKNNGNIVVITQSPYDINKSDVGVELVQNTLVFYILNHEGKDVTGLTKVFSFEDHEVEKVRSLRKDWDMEEGKKGGRELFIKRVGVDAKVYALEVPQGIYPLLTSKPSERNHLRKLLKTHSFERAIYEFVQDQKAKAI